MLLSGVLRGHPQLDVQEKQAAAHHLLMPGQLGKTPPSAARAAAHLTGY